MSLYQTLPGREKFNYSRPERVWKVTSPGWGRKTANLLLDCSSENDEYENKYLSLLYFGPTIVFCYDLLSAQRYRATEKELRFNFK